MKPIDQARIILASSAKWRSEILERAGIPHRAIAPRYNEPRYRGEPIGEFVRHLALEKARSLERDFPSAIVIGLDQMALCEGEVLGKPGNHEKAREQLKWLSGREHSLFNGLAVTYRGEELVYSDEAKLWMRPLSDEEIESYLTREKPYACAGSYQIEGLGSALFERVELSDMNSIIGLPLNLLHQALRRFGFSVLA